ncbi:MAG: PD-(D/E)XK nuclease family protein [Deltaproteobacteria bacterium]|nr:PD-(D/E)XK nuclease family protein [Deltaproteobacteria bacterium]
MAVQRIFLDWNNPCLPQAADWLIERAAGNDTIDLRYFRVVLPGGRAVRRLTELLVERAERDRKVLIPPSIITSGSLPEEFYSCNNRMAYAFERHMAWLQALENSDRESVQQILPRAPEKENLHAWFLVAQRFDKLYADVSSAALRFTDVARHCEANDALFPDERWQILSELHNSFAEALAAHSLADLHAERLSALEEGRCTYSGEIVLIGTSDLPLITRKMLLQNPGRCTALIQGPPDSPSFAKQFDELGCVEPQAWTDYEIPLEASHIEFARNPAEQAKAVVAGIAALKGTLAPEVISVGACSREAKPYIVEALTENKLPLVDASGFPVERAAPITFLKRAADYLQSRTFTAFATLIRHPHVQAAILKSGTIKTGAKASSDLLSSLDYYQSEHLQSEVFGALPEGNNKSHLPTLARKALHDILGELTGAPRPLSAWAAQISRVILALFGTAPLNPHVRGDMLIVSSCSALREELGKLQAFSPAQEVKVSAGEAIRLVLSQLSGTTLDLSGKEAAIEILGWLELQMDDAAALFITSMNEGSVPETLSSDPFLPNSLRSSLGLLDNERRYARDAYALTVISQSCPHLRLYATRLDSQGSPLRPSRLLFACSGKEIAQRIKTFFDSTKETSEALPEGSSTLAALEPPRPTPLREAPHSMSVTGFKDYIECPYRFYLKHILKLRSVDDSALELDPAAWGTLLHAVLSDFGRSSLKAETSEHKIVEFLLDTLADFHERIFGRCPLATVKIQRLLAEARLKAFANWQARWSSAGWEIKHVELEVEKDHASLLLPQGGSMHIQGRIDRVDVHHKSGEHFVFDYKTGDAGDTPAKTHIRGDSWVNLQLPLYFHLLRQSGLQGPLRLGYIVLPADVEKVKEEEAQWSPEVIGEALQIAANVAQSVHDQVFWPPNQLRRTEYDDYRILIPRDFAEFAEGA